jgi:hypothetical protein
MNPDLQDALIQLKRARWIADKWVRLYRGITSGISNKELTAILGTREKPTRKQVMRAFRNAIIERGHKLESASMTFVQEVKALPRNWEKEKPPCPIKCHRCERVINMSGPHPFHIVCRECYAHTNCTKILGAETK